MTANGLLHTSSRVQFIGEAPHVIILNLGLAGPEMCLTLASHLSESFSFTAGHAIAATIAAAAENSDLCLFRKSRDICVELKLPFDEENYG
jgi:hypothetical protein